MSPFKKRRIDIFKPVKKPKAPPPGNRIFKNHKIKWAGGTITVKAMIDQYPAGNIVTYVMSVRRRGKLLKVVKDKEGNEIEVRGPNTLIERSQYAEINSKTMLARIDELRKIPEANYE